MVLRGHVGGTALELAADLVAAQHRPAGDLAEVGGDGRLAGCRGPADQHEAYPRPFEMVATTPVVVRDLGGGVGVALAVAQTGDLGADVRPVGDVAMGEGTGMGFVAELAVPTGQGQRRLHAAETLDVHHQERKIGKSVAVSQPPVEGQAVEDPGAVGEAEDVLGQQVAVAVDDHTGANALLEQRGAAL